VDAKEDGLSMNIHSASYVGGCFKLSRMRDAKRDEGVQLVVKFVCSRETKEKQTRNIKVLRA